jgi:hypothetical protein
MEESQYFVEIKDPADMRRSMLGSSRQIIQILQRYERIKELRVMKLEKLAQLRTLNKEIGLIVAKLKKAFPKADFRVKVEKGGVSVSRVMGAHPGDDLGKLESELRMVEDKLSGL